MKITRRRFIAIAAAAGGLPLLPVLPGRAPTAVARLVGNGARLRRDTCRSTTPILRSRTD